MKYTVGGKTVPRCGFDFKAAVARAVHDHPALKNEAAFFDASTECPIYSNRFFDRIFNLPLSEKLREAIFPTKRITAKTLAQDYDKYGPHVFALSPSFGERKIMVMASGRLGEIAQLASRTAVAQAQAASRGAFIFTHELGHMVMPQTGVEDLLITFDESRPHLKLMRSDNENAADTFAALGEIGAGNMDKAALDDFALNRALMALEGDVGHYTAPALDAVAQMDDADILSLSPAEIKAVARRHAEIFTPSSDETLRIWHDLRHQRDLGEPLSPFYASLQLFGLAATAAGAQTAPNTVYLAARILRQAFDEQGLALATGTVRLTGVEAENAKKKVSDALQRIPDDHPLRLLDLNKVDILQRQQGPRSAAGLSLKAPALRA